MFSFVLWISVVLKIMFGQNEGLELDFVSEKWCVNRACSR